MGLIGNLLKVINLDRQRVLAGTQISSPIELMSFPPLQVTSRNAGEVTHAAPPGGNVCSVFTLYYSYLWACFSTYKSLCTDHLMSKVLSSLPFSKPETAFKVKLERCLFILALSKCIDDNGGSSFIPLIFPSKFRA